MTHLPIHGMYVISNVQSLTFGESLVRSAVFIIPIIISGSSSSSSNSFRSQAIPGDPIGFP